MAIGLTIMIVSVIFYVSLMTLVFPKRILKVAYKIGDACDRGVKKCLFKGKHCMVYDSSKENKPIIKQYLLLQEDGYKTIKCKVTPNVEYLDYDIVLYDRYNKVFDVINVKEDLLGVELTRSVRLPDRTSYVRIVIRRVNRTDMKKKPIVKITGGSIFLFSLVATLFTAVEALVIRSCCSHCFGEVFRESFVASREGLVVIGILAVAMGLLGALSVVISSTKRARK